MNYLTSSEKLIVLRTLLKTRKLDGLLVQRTDLFQGEEVRPCDERLAYISGFTGSAGYALILSDIAALFSDQRYILQMNKQTNPDEWQCYDIANHGIEEVISDASGLGREIIIGYDSWTMTASQVEKLPKNAGDILIKWVSLSESIIDRVWENRPDKQISEHWYMPEKMAGISAKQKISNLLELQGINDFRSVILVSSVDSVNWLLNIRGNTLRHTPIFHAMLLVLSETDIIIITEDRQKRDIKIDGLNILHNCFSEFPELTERLVGKKVHVDKATCPQAILEYLTEKDISIEFSSDATLLVKSQKNEIELAGMKEAHIKDAVAFCNFWYWFEQNNSEQKLGEYEVATNLSKFRAQQNDYLCDSFPAIVGFNDNGAIVHYRPRKNEDNKIEQDGVLLIDSGAHYKGGTTDVTRCFAIGNPPAAAIIANTLVIAAHLNLANTIFPKGTKGIQLDAICRQSLWSNKMDYGHGTGHGVGHVLSVHEGPASISKRGSQEILKGMILSNEPGYYEENEFGVRQENLVHVVAESDEFLRFENLTLIPFDNKLIDISVLTKVQISALNNYHKEVLEKISPYLKVELKEWFLNKCKPL